MCLCPSESCTNQRTVALQCTLLQYFIFLDYMLPCIICRFFIFLCIFLRINLINLMYRRRIDNMRLISSIGIMYKLHRNGQHFSVRLGGGERCPGRKSNPGPSHQKSELCKLLGKHDAQCTFKLVKSCWFSSQCIVFITFRLYFLYFSMSSSKHAVV